MRKVWYLLLVLTLCAIVMRLVHESKPSPVFKVDGVALGEAAENLVVERGDGTVQGFGYQELMESALGIGTEYVLNDSNVVVGIFGDELTFGTVRVGEGQTLDESRLALAERVDLAKPKSGELEVKVFVEENIVQEVFLGYRDRPLKQAIKEGSFDFNIGGFSLGDDAGRLEEFNIDFCHGQPVISHPVVYTYVADQRRKIWSLSGNALTLDSHTLKVGDSPEAVVKHLERHQAEYGVDWANIRTLDWKFSNATVRVSFLNDRADCFFISRPGTSHSLPMLSPDGEWVNL